MIFSCAQLNFPHLVYFVGWHLYVQSSSKTPPPTTCESAIKGPQVLQKAWDRTKTVRQKYGFHVHMWRDRRGFNLTCRSHSYLALGLLADVNSLDELKPSSSPSLSSSSSMVENAHAQQSSSPRVSAPAG